MTKVKFIKKDAQITIKCGAGFVEKLHKLLAGLISDKTDEEFEAYKKAIDDTTLTELPELWMENVAIITSLITLLEKEAEAQGQIFEEEVDDTPAQTSAE